MKLIFGRSKTLSSLAIRLWTWSTWSHVGIIHGRFVIEATAKDGVVITPINSFKNRYSETEEVSIPFSRGSSEQALRYVGCPYDWSAIFGIVLRSGWDNEDKWVCSELVAKVSGLFNDKYVSRITPNHLYMISTKG